MSEAGKRLIVSLKEAKDIVDGKADPKTYRVHSFGKGPDVLAIRLRLGLSQAKFAAKFGFSLDTLKKWEQKTRRPNGAALVLLRVIELRPEAVEEALSAA